MNLTQLSLGEILAWAKPLMKTYPELTFLRTLSTKQYTPDTLWGAVDCSNPGKKLADLMGVINAKEAEIVEFVERINTKIYLPLNYDSCPDFATRIRAFAKDYETIRHNRMVESGKFAESEEKRSLCINETYIYSPKHNEVVERVELARSIGTSNDRCVLVDRYLNNFIGECRTMLIDGKCIDGMYARPELIEELTDIQKRLGSTVSYDTFLAVTGLNDDRTIEFVCDLLGKSRSENRYAKIRAVSDLPLRKFDGNVGKIINFFRKEVVHIRYKNDFMPFLKKTFKSDEDLIRMFGDFVRNSHEFVWGIEEEDEVVALRWDLLEFNAAQVCWILYEEGAESLQTAIHSSKIQKIYAQKAKMYHINSVLPDYIVSKTQKDTCWRVASIGRSGYWMLRDNKKYEFNLNEATRNYILSNPSGDLDSFLKYADEVGISNIYDAGTLRTIFSNNGGKSNGRIGRTVTKCTKGSISSKKGIIGLAKVVLEENGAPMTLTTLYDEIVKVYPDYSKSSILVWLRNDSKTFSYTAGKGRNPSVVALVGMAGKAPTPYRTQIKEKAVEYLMTKEGYSDTRKAVYEKFSGEIPAGINNLSALSAIFGDTSYFVRTSGDDGAEATITLTKAIIERELDKRPVVADTLVALPKISEEYADEIYKKAPSYEWDVLKGILSKQLYTPFNKVRGFDFDKALNTMYYIMSEGTGKISESSAFHFMLSLLPDHYNHKLSADREAHLKDECTGCVETYLGNWYKLKYGRDITDDMCVDMRISTSSAGLGSMIAYLGDYLYTLPYKGFYDWNSVEYDIKQAVNRLKPARIDEIGHRKNFQDRSAITIETRIHDTLCVFAYMAAKL